MSCSAASVDAINSFKYALRHLVSIEGVEIVSREVNDYMKSLPSGYGIWEMTQTMSSKELFDSQAKESLMQYKAYKAKEKARTAIMQDKVDGVDYASELVGAN